MFGLLSKQSLYQFQIGGLSTCERKSLERKTLRSLSIGDNQSAISSLPRDILTKDGLSILHGTQDLHRYIPFSRSGAKSPPERYYWDIPDSFGCQPRCTRSSQNCSSRSDTATFIQDCGQVPFEPQIQRTFSVDKRSDRHSKQPSRVRPFTWPEPFKATVPTFRPSTGPVHLPIGLQIPLFQRAPVPSQLIILCWSRCNPS